MTTVAVAGIGAWGQNLVRTFDTLTTVPVCCHSGREANAEWLRAEYPEIELTTDYDAVLGDDHVDAVAIATPIPTLADLAERALDAGKHVYVEKPMAATRSEAERLARLAGEREPILFVGYIFVYHPLFTRARKRAASEEIRRARLEWETEGTFGPDLVNNLVCHPVSVAVAEFGRPERVDVIESRTVTGDTDVVECRLSYPDAGVTCAVRVDRVSPTPGYTLRAVTERDGIYAATDDSFHVFEAERSAYESSREDVDPLGTECRAFVEAVETGASPVTDGAFGADVHAVLAEIKNQL
jgi:UDP-2-acetamido-3-amino-2,3-dideoxy-glucuronate N-acetyltransferase